MHSLIRLDLHLGETMLPDSDERSDTILAVVHENDPNIHQQEIFLSGLKIATYIPSGSIDSPM